MRLTVRAGGGGSWWDRTEVIKGLDTQVGGVDLAGVMGVVFKLL